MFEHHCLPQYCYYLALGIVPERGTPPLTTCKDTLIAGLYENGQV